MLPLGLNLKHVVYPNPSFFFGGGGDRNRKDYQLELNTCMLVRGWGGFFYGNYMPVPSRDSLGDPFFGMPGRNNHI